MRHLLLFIFSTAISFSQTQPQILNASTDVFSWPISVWVEAGHIASVSSGTASYMETGFGSAIVNGRITGVKDSNDFWEEKGNSVSQLNYGLQTFNSSEFGLFLDDCGSTSATTSHYALITQSGNSVTTTASTSGFQDYPCIDCNNKRKSFSDCKETPLVIDYGKDGIHLGDSEHLVLFDIRGDGYPVSLQWVKPGENEMFLALDLNGNNLVDDGSELFGSGSILFLSNSIASHGFQALAQYDDPLLGGNDDGLISAHDEVWERLLFWHDFDADGSSNELEIYRAADYDIGSIEIAPKQNNRRDPHGNSIGLWSKAYISPHGYGNHRVVADVFFLVYN